MNFKIKETKQYDGIIVDVYNTSFETKAGPFKAEVLKHPGGSTIAATHDNVHFYMVDQYRFGANKMMTEFPAEKRDHQEDFIDVAQRELQEEIGYQANTIVPLGYIETSPAFLDETLYLYYATDLEFVGQNLDEGEEVRVHQMTLDEIDAAIVNNEITDAKTIALAMRLRHYVSNL